MTSLQLTIMIAYCAALGVADSIPEIRDLSLVRESHNSSDAEEPLKPYDGEVEDKTGITGLIIGGGPVARNAYRFMVSLQSASGFHFCGGSIVSPRHILTAAHCLKEDNGDTRSKSNLRVGVGLRNNKHGTGANYYSVSDINLHSGYDRSNAYANDLAVLTLTRPITVTRGRDAATIELPKTWRNNPRPGTKVVGVGWGYLENSDSNGEGRSPEYLRGAVFRILAESDCARRTRVGVMPDSKVCIDSSKNAVCKGDSGGPLFRELSPKVYELIGVTSYTFGECQQSGSANVFTRVSQFLPWIAAAMTDA